MRKLVLSHYSISFFTNLAVMAMGIVSSILLARTLGADGRGEIAAVLLWPTLVSYLGNLGIPDAIVYYAAQTETKRMTIYVNSLVLAVVQSLVSFFITYLAMPGLLASQTELVITLSQFYLIIIPLSLISQYTNSILRAELHITRYNLAQVIVPAGNIISVVLFSLSNSLTVSNIAIALILFNTLSTLASVLMLLLPKRPNNNWRLSLSYMRKLIFYGLQAHLGTVFGTANLRLDQTLIAAWFPASELGLYVIAVNTANLLLILPRAIITVVTPRIASIADQAARVAGLRTIFQQSWLLSLIAAGGTVIILPWAIPLVYGTEFQSAVGLAEVLVLGAVLRGARGLLVAGTQALGRPWLASQSEIYASIITLVGLFVLLPTFGLMAAAVISVFAYALSVFVILRGISQYDNIPLVEWLRIDRSFSLLVQRARQFMAQYSQ